MKTVYDPQGNPVEMEGVDARECVEHCGYTMERQEEMAMPKAEEDIKGKKLKMRK